MRETVTLFVPHGYKDAAEFLKDCQFECAKDVPTWMQGEPASWQFRFKPWGSDEWSGWSTLPDNWDGVRNPDHEYRPLYP